MSLRSRRSGIVFATACAFGAVLMHRADAAPTMRICADETNPSADTDVRIARAAAATQGYEVRESHFVGHGKEADDGFPIARFAKMARSDCELIVGFPVDAHAPRLPPDVASTAPYASTGFALVEPGDARPKPLAELPKGSEVGIAQLDTWAGLLFAANPNIVMHVYVDDAEMLDDLGARRLAAGLTWQPYLAAYEKSHRKHARMSASILAGAHMRWNLVALYADSSREAADAFGKGIAALRDDGRLARLVPPYEAAAESHDGANASRASRASRTCEKPAKAKKNAALPKPPALYTEAQATKGMTEYLQNCGMCHGPLLDGQKGGFPGPALKGKDFADPSYDFHVNEIFRFVAKLMPAMKPGSLSDDQNVAIMAYLLQQNGYPAGTTELTYDGASKSTVPIRYYGK